MPVLKHAKKKLRQDHKRELENKQVRGAFKSLIKKAKAKPTVETISAAFKGIDKAAKNNVIHKNKAARLKSSISKLTNGKVAVATIAKKAAPGKTTGKKSSKKSAKPSGKK